MILLLGGTDADSKQFGEARRLVLESPDRVTLLQGRLTGVPGPDFEVFHLPRTSCGWGVDGVPLTAALDVARRLCVRIVIGSGAPGSNCVCLAELFGLSDAVRPSSIDRAAAARGMCSVVLPTSFPELVAKVESVAHLLPIDRSCGCGATPSFGTRSSRVRVSRPKGVDGELCLVLLRPVMVDSSALSQGFALIESASDAEIVAVRMVEPSPEKVLGVYQGRGLERWLASILATNLAGRSVAIAVRGDTGICRRLSDLAEVFRARWGGPIKENPVHVSEDAASGDHEVATYFPDLRLDTPRQLAATSDDVDLDLTTAFQERR